MDSSSLPEHVQRIIERDAPTDLPPPSFERWLGRLQMLRTISSMGGFTFITLISVNAGHEWETAAVRGIAAAIICYFFAWAAGLFIFGELYEVEIARARRQMEERERERVRRIEQYYHERLTAQREDRDALGLGDEHSDAPTQITTQPMSTMPPATGTRREPSIHEQHRSAA